MSRSTSLPEFASERRFLPECIPFRIPLPVHLVGVEPAQVELPKQFGEKHAHFEVRETIQLQCVRHKYHVSSILRALPNKGDTASVGRERVYQYLLPS